MFSSWASELHETCEKNTLQNATRFRDDHDDHLTFVTSTRGLASKRPGEPCGTTQHQCAAPCRWSPEKRGRNLGPFQEPSVRAGKRWKKHIPLGMTSIFLSIATVTHSHCLFLETHRLEGCGCTLNWAHLSSKPHKKASEIFPEIGTYCTPARYITGFTVHGFTKAYTTILHTSVDAKLVSARQGMARHMVVDVDNWRRKASCFEALDDGVHVSPQGVCGPIHTLPGWMLDFSVPLGLSCGTLLNHIFSRSINLKSMFDIKSIQKSENHHLQLLHLRNLMTSSSASHLWVIHLARVLDTKLLQSEALLFKDVDLALGPFLQGLKHKRLMSKMFRGELDHRIILKALYSINLYLPDMTSRCWWEFSSSSRGFPEPSADSSDGQTKIINLQPGSIQRKLRRENPVGHWPCSFPNCFFGLVKQWIPRIVSSNLRENSKIWSWLVVSTPLKNMKVNSDDDIPNIWKVISQSCSSHHHPGKIW